MRGLVRWHRLMKSADDSTIKRLLMTVHEYSADATVILVVMHVTGVVWESVLHRENLVRSMITGRKRVIVENEASRNSRSLLKR